MTATMLKIAPVVKSVRVETAQARAFEIFTAGITRWWPRFASFNRGAPMKDMFIEGRVGGRWYEVGEDGSEMTLGRVLAWEPPRRFAMTWTMHNKWKPGADVATEVEVTFAAEGPAATRVELSHGLFERLGEEAGAAMRPEVERGWGEMAERFKAHAEGREYAGESKPCSG
ncbi:MAG: SRPBCC family protein [Rhodospirillales bacterium]|nr:SRPBCC family protein [Rhodospirillales bacterium]